MLPRLPHGALLLLLLLLSPLLLLQVAAQGPEQARLIREKTQQVELEAEGSRQSEVFYQTPQPEPFEGLPPPQRPNFQPVYSDRTNDKSVRERRSEPAAAPLPSVEVFSPAEGQPAGDLAVGESRVEYRSPTYSEATPRRADRDGRSRGDSGLRRRVQPPRPKVPRLKQARPPPPPASNAARRDGLHYDPRPQPPPQIYPIPIEFINQIPGAGQPLQQGSIRLDPETVSFQPSSHIEQIVNGIPKLVEDTSKPFFVEVDLAPNQNHNPTTRSLHHSQGTPIFREEYPKPQGTPYPPVPYHDSRVEAHTQATGEDGTAYRYMHPPHQAGLPYTELPSLPSPTHQPTIFPADRHGSHHGPSVSGLKTGYFPPTSRVMPRVSHIEAECRDDFMKLRVAFNDSFAGLIYSAGYTHDNDCMYINGTGGDVYDFYIQLNRCGTLGGSDHNKREVKNTKPTKNYMWNTVTIQYNPLIEEEWDEHFKVTCEYGYDFWKTVTFPFLEVETNTADPVVFTLTPPECFMEIRSGYGLTGPRITGPVHVGDPVTLAINMRSRWDGFDMVVNDCVAHNGANKKIQLIDHQGCPVDEKLIAKFQGTWSEASSMYETVIYAHMKTFRFTGTPALYIECDVRMCHGKCPVMPCDWREGGHSHHGPPAHHVRRRRAAGNVTAVELEEEDRALELDRAAKSLGNFSESLNLFQSIQVLANEEEERAFRNENATRVLVDEADFCFSSLIFTSFVAAVTALLVLSGLSISLLCARVRRHDRGGKESASDIVHTLRSSRSVRSEYVHSPQARIP